MLPRLHRLVKNSDFKNVMKHGNTFFSPDFIIKSVHSLDKQDSRFGIIVSTKVSLKSTERNLLKRRIRSIIKDFLSKTKNIPRDVVVIAKKSSINKSYQDIEEQIVRGFKYAFKNNN